MAVKYLSSNQVKVYPSGYRSASIDVEASRTTEGSVRKALLAPLAFKSFIKDDGDGTITIVLGGYTFNISASVLEGLWEYFDSSTKIYAYIKLDTTSSLTMLINADDEDSPNVLDEDGTFYGIAFTDTLPSVDYKLLIYEWVDGPDGGYWDIPQASKLVVSSNQVEDLSTGKPISDTLTIDNDLCVGKDVTIEEDLSVGGDDIKFTHNSLKGNNLSLGIDSNGKVFSQSQASEYTRTADSGNTVKVIGSIKQNSMGKIADGNNSGISEVSLPLANVYYAGLVSIGNQTFGGMKTFYDGLTTPQDSNGNKSTLTKESIVHLSNRGMITIGDTFSQNDETITRINITAPVSTGASVSSPHNEAEVTGKFIKYHYKTSTNAEYIDTDTALIALGHYVDSDNAVEVSGLSVYKPVSREFTAINSAEIELHDQSNYNTMTPSSIILASNSSAINPTTISFNGITTDTIETYSGATIGGNLTVARSLSVTGTLYAPKLSLTNPFTTSSNLVTNANTFYFSKWTLQQSSLELNEGDLVEIICNVTFQADGDKQYNFWPPKYSGTTAYSYEKTGTVNLGVHRIVNLRSSSTEGKGTYVVVPISYIDTKPQSPAQTWHAFCLRITKDPTSLATNFYMGFTNYSAYVKDIFSSVTLGVRRIG